MLRFHVMFFASWHLMATCCIQGLSFTTFKEILQFKTKNTTFINIVYFLRFCISYSKILKYPWIQVSPDWSCTVLLHNRTCCGKYRILYVLIDLCNSEMTHLVYCPVCICTAYLLLPKIQSGAVLQINWSV